MFLTKVLPELIANFIPHRQSASISHEDRPVLVQRCASNFGKRRRNEVVVIVAGELTVVAALAGLNGDDFSICCKMQC